MAQITRSAFNTSNHPGWIVRRITIMDPSYNDMYCHVQYWYTTQWNVLHISFFKFPIKFPYHYLLLKLENNVITRTSETNIRGYVCLVCAYGALPFLAICNRFSLYLDHCWLQITAVLESGAKLFCIWNFLFVALFWHPWIALKGPLIVHFTCIITVGFQA